MLVVRLLKESLADGAALARAVEACRSLLSV